MQTHSMPGGHRVPIDAAWTATLFSPTAVKGDSIFPSSWVSLSTGHILLIIKSSLSIKQEEQSLYY